MVLLRLSRFQETVPLDIANELTTEAVEVLESLASTCPSQEAGISNSDLITDLEKRMSVMGRRMGRGKGRGQALGGRGHTNIESVLTSSTFAGMEASSSKGKGNDTTGDDDRVPPILKDSRLARIIPVLHEILTRLRCLHEGQHEDDSKKAGKRFFTMVC